MSDKQTMLVGKNQLVVITFNPFGDCVGEVTVERRKYPDKDAKDCCPEHGTLLPCQAAGCDNV